MKSDSERREAGAMKVLARTASVCAATAAVLLLQSGTAGGPPTRATGVSFLRDVAPIVLKRCAGCHGERRDSGGYRMHTYAAILRPGASGAAGVVPRAATKSELFKRIVANGPRRMPMQDDPLSAGQIETIRRWIDAGAVFDGTDPTSSFRSQLGPRTHPPAPPAYRAAVPVLAVALSPGGDEVYVGGYHEVTVWRTDTGKLARRIGNLPQRTQSLAFSPDGRKLLVAGGTPGEYGELAVVDVARGVRERVLEACDEVLISARFKPDGECVVAGGADAAVRVYEFKTGRRLWQSRVQADWVTGVAFSGDGRFVAASSKDMTVKIFDAGSGALFATYTGHNRQLGQYRGQSPVYAVAFGPGSNVGCSAGGGAWLQLWEPEKTRDEAGDAGDMEERFARKSHARYIPHGFKGDVFSLAVTRDRVFAGSADGVIKAFDTVTLKEVGVYSLGPDWVYSLNFDPASGRLVAGSFSGDVAVWDCQSGKKLISFTARPGIVGGPG